MLTAFISESGDPRQSVHVVRWLRTYLDDILGQMKCGVTAIARPGYVATDCQASCIL